MFSHKRQVCLFVLPLLAVKVLRPWLTKARDRPAVEIEFLPWNRAVDAVTNGEADGYFPEYPSANDSEKYRYACQMPAVPQLFVGIKGKTHGWPSLDGLKGSANGLVRAYRDSMEDSGELDRLASEAGITGPRP